MTDDKTPLFSTDDFRKPFTPGIPATTISVPIHPTSINPRHGRIDTFDRVALHNKIRDEAIIAALQEIRTELNKMRTEGIMVKK